jgi:hypothetical protein
MPYFVSTSLAEKPLRHSTTGTSFQVKWIRVDTNRAKGYNRNGVKADRLLGTFTPRLNPHIR